MHNKNCFDELPKNVGKPVRIDGKDVYTIKHPLDESKTVKVILNPDEAARARGQRYVEVIAQPRSNKVIIKQEDKPTSTVDSSSSTIYAESGQVGRGWNNYMNNPQNFTNTTFHSNGYTFRTDSLGRPENVSGKLTLKTTDVNTRNSNAQVKAGGADRGSDDHGGHLIASMFNGPGESLNLVPMDRWVNGAGGKWYDLGGFVEKSTR